PRERLRSEDAGHQASARRDGVLTRADLHLAGAGAGCSARPLMPASSIAAAKQSRPDTRKTPSYVPALSRKKPAAQAAAAPPSWCAAKTHAKATVPVSRPKRWVMSATVGGTVAIQSKP